MKRKPTPYLILILLSVLVLFSSCESDSEEPTPMGNNNSNNNNNNSGPDGNMDNSSSIDGCQYPVAATLDGNNFDLQIGSFKVINRDHTVYRVFGYSFEVAFDGSIKELGVRVPEVGTYTVRVYDAEIGKDDILVEIDISVSTTDWTYVTIDPFAISTDITYMVGVYFRSKPDEQETLFNHIPDFEYPVKHGDVTILGYATDEEIEEKVKPEPKDSDAFTLFNGLVDFCFEAN